MNLVLDIGNTCCKTAIYSENAVVESAVSSFSIPFIKSLIDRFPDSLKMYACVADIDESDMNFLKENGFRNIHQCARMPVESAYKTPETLGEDRWAAVCGAAFLIHNKFPFLVIQIGTALTFDYVNSQGHYTGGAISPGISLRLRALHNFTGRLPLVEPEKEVPFMGLTTKHSILSGVLLGCLAEIQFRIDEFRKNNSKAGVFISGGDQGYFDLSHKNNTFAVPDIVLVGLNHLLNLNP